MSAVPSSSVDAVAAGRNANSSGDGNGGSGGGRGEGSSSTSDNAERPLEDTTRTLDEVMREPSTTVPGVVVLDSLPEAPGRRDVLDPEEDLWLSTVDG